MVFSSQWCLLCCDLGDRVVVEDFELQRQVMCSLNSVLYEQLQYKGNECDYYNPLNSYIHQVCILMAQTLLEPCSAFNPPVPCVFRAGAATPYRYSHQPVCCVHDISPETGCSAGACQLSQPLPVTLVPETTGVCLWNVLRIEDIRGSVRTCWLTVWTSHSHYLTAGNVIFPFKLSDLNVIFVLFCIWFTLSRWMSLLEDWLSVLQCCVQCLQAATIWLYLHSCSWTLCLERNLSLQPDIHSFVLQALVSNSDLNTNTKETN